MAQNLWGTIPTAASERTPKQLLSEQAMLLGQATSGRLIGSVSTRNGNEKVTCELSILVPAMNNYSVELLAVNYDPTSLYPAWLVAGGPVLKVESEAALAKAIGDRLQSERVHRIITSLLAHAAGD